MWRAALVADCVRVRVGVRVSARAPRPAPLQLRRRSKDGRTGDAGGGCGDGPWAEAGREAAQQGAPFGRGPCMTMPTAAATCALRASLGLHLELAHPLQVLGQLLRGAFGSDFGQRRAAGIVPVAGRPGSVDRFFEAGLDGAHGEEGIGARANCNLAVLLAAASLAVRHADAEDAHRFQANVRRTRLVWLSVRPNWSKTASTTRRTARRFLASFESPSMRSRTPSCSVSVSTRACALASSPLVPAWAAASRRLERRRRRSCSSPGRRH